MRWEQDLVKDIRLGDYRDDLDWPCDWINQDTKGKNHFEGLLPEFELWQPEHDFSDANREKLKELFLQRRDHTNCIVEIGVCREYRTTANTSTGVFFDNKLQKTHYIGIDIRDLRSLESRSRNIKLFRMDSSDISRVERYMNGEGIKQIDFLMIDGWHGINQVLKDWEYTKFLAEDGIVAFHDTAYHPGPYLFINALDNSKWHVVHNACSDNKKDFGIGFAWRKK